MQVMQNFPCFVMHYFIMNIANDITKACMTNLVPCFVLDYRGKYSIIGHILARLCFDLDRSALINPETEASLLMEIWKKHGAVAKPQCAGASHGQRDSPLRN